MFWIGMHSYLKKELVVSVSRYDMAENKRKCKRAKDNYMLSDYSNGHKKESVIFLSNGEVYISPLTVEEIINGNSEGEQ